MAPVNQADIDEKNSAFWNELCGSHMARSAGVTDDSPESLARFDKRYFDFYPYLFDHIPFAEMAGRKVLEVGLGYGTVGQRIAMSGAAYHGLDIAAGPVAMMEHRLGHLGLAGDLRQGSILAPPFAAGSFDWVVAIGCLHHTGDLAAAIGSVYDLLAPGGRAMVMVYNAASYRQWLRGPLATRRRLREDPATYSQRIVAADERMRGTYDAGRDGSAAPQTEFVTAAELGHLCRAFSRCDVTLENIGGTILFIAGLRPLVCRLFGPFFGLDLYCRLTK
ncbi:MAG: class I SAM-dependent methyltransferase [Kiloniellaceae bacterium]